MREVNEVMDGEYVGSEKVQAQESFQHIEVKPAKDLERTIQWVRKNIS